MNITAEIHNTIRSAKKSLAVFLGACICLSFISSAWAATVEESCVVSGSKWKVATNRHQEKPKPQFFGSSANQCLQMPLSKISVSSYVGLQTDKSNGKDYANCPIKKGCREHQGMDLSTGLGDAVMAIDDGEIMRFGETDGGGKTVYIRHQKADGGCYLSVYMHLNDYNANVCKTGKKISKGSVIGTVGGTNYKCGKLLYTTKDDKRESVTCKDKTHSSYAIHLHIELHTLNDCKDDNAKRPVLDPTCPSIQGLCAGKTPSSEPPITSFTPLNDKDGRNGGTNFSFKSNATASGCGKLLPENDITELHQSSESNQKPESFNCLKGDAGGNTYGLSGFTCGFTAFQHYLQYLQKSYPALFEKIQVGGSLESTQKAACPTPKDPSKKCETKPSDEFLKKWKALAAGSDKNDFIKSQKEFVMNSTDLKMTLSQKTSKQFGVTMSDLNKRSPEVQMALLSVRINKGNLDSLIEAMSKGPLRGKNINNISDEEFINALYDVYPSLNNSGYDKGIANRAAKERKLTLESLAIRQEIAKGKSPEEASQAVTGLPPCKDGEFPDINVTTVAYGADGHYAGGSIGIYDDDGAHECNAKSYRNSFKGCIFCDVFGVLYNTASVLAKKSHNALANGIISLVCIGFALWLGMTILPIVSSMDNKGNPSALFKTILNKAFLILCVVLLLRMDSSEFFRLTLEPLFNTGFQLAQLAVSGAGGETCKNLYHILSESEGAGLPPSMGVSILCTIETIQGKLLDIMSIGSTSFCVGLYVKSWHNIPLLPHWEYLIIGVILWIAALMFMVIYPFLLIDSVLQLCVATALLPAAIGAFAFKWSQGYSKKMWNIFLNCMFNFIFLSLIILILTNGLNQIVDEIISSTLLEVGTGSDYDTIHTSLAWWSIEFIKLVFYLILGWSVLKEVNSFANSFASGLSLEIGNMVGGLAANVAHKTSSKALSLGTKATSKVFKAGGRVVADTFNNARNNYRMRRIEKSSRTTIDENGNQVLQRRTLTGRRVTETLQTNPDGTQSLTRQKGSRFGIGGNKAVSTDQFISNKKHYDKNGNLIREEMSMTFAAGRSLLHSDGTRNEVAIQAIRSGSGMSKDDVDKAIMNQMLKERMPGLGEDADMSKKFTSRTASRTVDAAGREVFTVTQTNKDGSTSIYQMTKGDKRDMLTYTRINQKGQAISYSSDGIINKKSTYKVDAKGNIDARSVKNNYAFAKGHRSEHYQSMDSNGMLHHNIPVDEIMMSQEDMVRFKEQIATYGKDQAMGEFNK